MSCTLPSGHTARIIEPPPNALWENLERICQRYHTTAEDQHWLLDQQIVEAVLFHCSNRRESDLSVEDRNFLFDAILLGWRSAESANWYPFVKPAFIRHCHDETWRMKTDHEPRWSLARSPADWCKLLLVDGKSLTIAQFSDLRKAGQLKQHPVGTTRRVILDLRDTELLFGFKGP